MHMSFFIRGAGLGAPEIGYGEQQIGNILTNNNYIAISLVSKEHSEDMLKML